MGGRRTERHVSGQLSPLSRDIARLDPNTGERHVLFTITAADGTGVDSLTAPVVSADGGTYVYRLARRLSDLFIAQRLQ